MARFSFRSSTIGSSLLSHFFARSDHANRVRTTTYLTTSTDTFTPHLLNVFPFPGFIVLTTSSGIIDHEEARRKHTGGKVLGFFY
jgi:ribosomal protein S8